MLKTLNKFAYMGRLGSRYIKIYKKTYFHPFMSKRAMHSQLSLHRQEYSNSMLKYLNIEIDLFGELPQQNRVLYAINHRSLLDIIVMEHVFSKHNKNGTWIAKQELFNSIYGGFFKYSGCIGVDLENRKGFLSFFKQIKNVLSSVDDLNVYIFPEGERHKGKGIKEFQNGASKIAKTNNLDIVPVYIKDSLENVFKHAPYKQVKKVQVHVGDIIDANNLQNSYIEFMNGVK